MRRSQVLIVGAVGNPETEAVWMRKFKATEVLQRIWGHLNHHEQFFYVRR